MRPFFHMAVRLESDLQRPRGGHDRGKAAIAQVEITPFAPSNSRHPNRSMKALKHVGFVPNRGNFRTALWLERCRRELKNAVHQPRQFGVQVTHGHAFSSATGWRSIDISVMRGAKNPFGSINIVCTRYSCDTERFQDEFVGCAQVPGLADVVQQGRPVFQAKVCSRPGKTCVRFMP